MTRRQTTRHALRRRGRGWLGGGRRRRRGRDQRRQLDRLSVARHPQTLRYTRGNKVSAIGVMNAATHTTEPSSLADANRPGMCWFHDTAFTTPLCPFNDPINAPLARCHTYTHASYNNTTRYFQCKHQQTTIKRYFAAARHKRAVCAAHTRANDKARLTRSTKRAQTSLRVEIPQSNCLNTTKTKIVY